MSDLTIYNKAAKEAEVRINSALEQYINVWQGVKNKHNNFNNLDQTSEQQFKDAQQELVKALEWVQAIVQSTEK